MAITYTTVEALASEPGCASLTDDEAEALIVRAEDIADELLGAWPVDDLTGRKIILNDIEAWQWARLGRFVTRLAARLHLSPEAVDAGQWTSVRGPDFAFSGPRAGGWEQRIGAELLLILNGTGLRRLGSRVGSRRMSMTRSELDALWWGEDYD